jgi:hypothetical protein
MKGGLRTFAALCIEVCCADKVTFRCDSYQGLLYWQYLSFSNVL